MPFSMRAVQYPRCSICCFTVLIGKMSARLQVSSCFTWSLPEFFRRPLAEHAPRRLLTAAWRAFRSNAAAAANPWVVHVARMRRHQGTESQEVRRGPVDEAGPLAEEGIDPGRSVVPAGAEAEADITLRAFEGGIAATGTVRAPWTGICRRCATPVGCRSRTERLKD